jgi:hypothetical protein
MEGGPNSVATLRENSNASTRFTCLRDRSRLSEVSAPNGFAMSKSSRDVPRNDSRISNPADSKFWRTSRAWMEVLLSLRVAQSLTWEAGS